MPKNIFNFEGDENAELRALAKKSVCFLPISIGQKYHTGEAWRETIRQMNQYFGVCVIVPVDGLHRFTEMMKDKNLTEEEAEAIALRDGDAWLSSVDHINKKLRIPNFISRWSDWVSTPEFALSKAEVVNSYNDEESDFRTYVDIVINNFITGFINKQVKSNKAGNHIKLNIQRATELCKLYLLEELAFANMLKNKFVSPQVSHFINDQNLSEFVSQRFFKAYPFGNNSTNEDAYNCFEYLCADELLLINSSKPPKQQKQKKASTPDQKLSIDVEPLLTLKKDRNATVYISSNDMKEQIVILQDSAAGLHTKTVSPVQKHPAISTVSEEKQATSLTRDTFFAPDKSKVCDSTKEELLEIFGPT
jgi:hypothetical protein